MRLIREAASEREAQVCVSAEQAEAAMREALKPATDIFERFGVEHLLDDLIATARRGYAGKQWLNEYQGALAKMARETSKGRL